jgi:hypothetical protein
MSEFAMTEQQFGGFGQLFVDILSERITPEVRAEMAKNLKDWLETEARVKPVPDIATRKAKMAVRFDKLAAVATFSKDGDEIVVKASGENSDTVKMLENGTDWFDPCESVVRVMISALRKT